MPKRKRQTEIAELLTAAARLPKGPKVRVGKHITGGQLTMRFMCPIDAKQEQAITAMLDRHTNEILSEAGRITGKDMRVL